MVGLLLGLWRFLRKQRQARMAASEAARTPSISRDVARIGVSSTESDRPRVLSGIQPDS